MSNQSDSLEQHSLSKSQLKRDSQAYQDLGKQLVEMSEGNLQKFALPDPLKMAIYEARKLKSREARRRQLQYIGKLIRTSDVEIIQQILDKINYQTKNYRQHFAQLENWRDRIVNEGNTAIEAFMALHPDADRQQLRNLQRQTTREVEHNKPPLASRKLFAYLRQLAD